MTASQVSIKFQIGARTLFAIRRRLVRVPLDLEQVLAGHGPALPPLGPADHGHAITSLPETMLDTVARDGRIAFVRQRYTRYYADLTTGFDAWFAQLSSNARSQLKRKAKRIAASSGGMLDVRRFRTPTEMETFHPIARAVSATTYQEKLLDAGLPDDVLFWQEMLALAAADRVRAWLLYSGDQPVAYLYCPVVGGDVIYAYLGHDPAANDLSPGAVLQLEAMRDLFAEGRFRRFDFTEGEGQHKRQMASGGVACVDLLLLRPGVANRLTLAAVKGFDGAVAHAKRAAQSPALAKLARRVRRG